MLVLVVAAYAEHSLQRSKLLRCIFLELLWWQLFVWGWTLLRANCLSLTLFSSLGDVVIVRKGLCWFEIAKQPDFVQCSCFKHTWDRKFSNHVSYKSFAWELLQHTLCESKKKLLLPLLFNQFISKSHWLSWSSPLIKLLQRVTWHHQPEKN